MAGDWIKMRGALLDHPKVIAIGRALHKNKHFREWLTPGGSAASNGHIIGDQALRCVTTALLMRLWSVSREHGKFVEHDLVLEHSEIADLDQMAGAPGVGEAMQAVRWAIPENGVTLPNFKEFNVPMTAAEKQREYRKRNASGNGGVTETLPNESNGSAENVTSRVEKRRTTTPTPPSGAFLQFWEVWPKHSRKQSKGLCWERWRKFELDPAAAEIIKHVEALKLSSDWSKDGGAYIPAPLVYLNQRRWQGAETAGKPEPQVAMP